MAMEDVRKACGDGSAEKARLAVHALVEASAGADDDQLREASGLVEEALGKSRAGGGKSDQGSLLAAKGWLLCARATDSEAALACAEEALEIFRTEAGQTGGLAASLEVLIRARALQNDPQAGFREAQKELARLKQAGQPKGQAEVLEVITHAHASLGEPVSAVSAASQALVLYRSLAAGEKDGMDWPLGHAMPLGEKMRWAREQEGNMLHTIAEMRWAQGDLPGADQAAKQAVTAYEAAKCKSGKDRCLATISSLCAQQGKIKKAPNRQEALKTLKELAAAIKSKDASAFKEAEEKLNEMRDCLLDEEIAENLGPLMQNADHAGFLQEQGWMVDDGAQAQLQDGKKDTYIRQFHHRAFYLNTLFTGMGFGPQFRPVHPFRAGRKPEDFIAMEVCQLPECEAWQMEMFYRPGVIDSCIQQQSVLSFP